MTRPKTKGKRRYRKFTRETPVLIYRCFRAGMSLDAVRAELGIADKAWYMWFAKYPEVRHAVNLAKADLDAAAKSLPDWIYDRMAPDLKVLWDKVCEWEKEDNGIAKIELMLQDHGIRVRQRLFLHALCAKAFNPSQAMKMLGLSKRELDRWVEEDPQFKELIQEVEWHKGNFFESKLVELVQRGHAAAIIQTNKAYNASRGYGERTKLDVNVSGAVGIGTVDLFELMPYMSEDVKLGLMEAIRRRDIERRPLTIEGRIEKNVTGMVQDLILEPLPPPGPDATAGRLDREILERVSSLPPEVRDADQDGPPNASGPT